MRESEIEAYLVERVKALGGEVRKVRWIGRRGAPDRVVMLPERRVKAFDGILAPGAICYADPQTLPARSIWVELKATDQKPEPHQLREHVRMRAVGLRVEVVDSLEGVEVLLS